MLEVNKKMFLWGAIVLAVLVAVFLFAKPKTVEIVCTQEAKLCSDGSYVGRTEPNCEFALCPILPGDHKDASYAIDGKKVTLMDGYSETEIAPDSASKIITRYFGNEVRADLNDDGRGDIVFLLTQEIGGTGTFFYVVVALNTEDGYIGSHGLLLGDRIAPQTTEISRNPSHKNVIIVNYADRNPGEPMSAKPSVGKSVWLKLDQKTMQFGEVVQNFEGEADSSKMTLTMKPWYWISAVYNDGTQIKPRNPDKFVLTFKNNKVFSASTDCNGVGGEYAMDGNKISFDIMFSTLMYCEGSQEKDFSKMLGEILSYHPTSKGELILEFKFDSGYMVFR